MSLLEHTCLKPTLLYFCYYLNLLPAFKIPFECVGLAQWPYVHSFTKHLNNALNSLYTVLSNLSVKHTQQNSKMLYQVVS